MEWFTDLFTDEPVLAGIIVAIAVVVIVALVAWYIVRRRRTGQLERRFGAEYQRTVDASGSRREAERDLDVRRRQREQMDIRPLTPGARDDLRARFEDVQTSFVDAPESALRSANHLVAEVAALRGYGEGEAANRLDIVSVDHPEDVAVHQRNLRRLDGVERISTEDLRQGVLAARRLFEKLVSEGEADDAAAPRPPRSLLGLDETDTGDEAHVGGNEVSATDADARSGEEWADSREEPEFGTGGVVGEASARTMSTRPDDDNGVRETVDVSRRRRLEPDEQQP